MVHQEIAYSYKMICFSQSSSFEVTVHVTIPNLNCKNLYFKMLYQLILNAIYIYIQISIKKTAADQSISRTRYSFLKKKAP
jgi:hypothetical protein